MKQAMEQGHMVVEGVYSARAGLELARKYQVEVPIIQRVNEILFENKPAAEAVGELMQRVRKDELNKW